ncbi:hypothetical protein M9H77_33057 [Catharanthus roseus]|uniref:Uncharacterized protein n=1 Tax=Catharanthus roseus TaxID=4058 RepID=A0ACC0A4N7_CATRO|nr:hypothetical protein M9H77_33057 [Catharanthus roseus]
MEIKKGFFNFFIVIIFLSLLSGSLDAFPSPQGMEKNATLINEACKKSKDFDLCLSILKGYSGGAKTNIDDLAIFILKYAIGRAKETINLVNKLETNTTDKVLKVCFEGCAVDYERFIDHCYEAIDAIKKFEYPDAETIIDWALETESSCEDCFSEFQPPHKSPITNVNNFNARILLIAGYMLP